MEKIKQFMESEQGKDILIVIIVILVGAGCFELGRLSKENNSGGVKIIYPSQDSNTIQPDNSRQTSLKTGKTNLASVVSSQINNKNFFASSKGSKYYTISCSAGKTIKKENRIYFTTGEEAQKAGYTLSSSCN